MVKAIPTTLLMITAMNLSAIPPIIPRMFKPPVNHVKKHKGLYTMASEMASLGISILRAHTTKQTLTITIYQTGAPSAGVPK